jgi:membrane-bound metal-dependent hydrolase YbcI (DUF457 family)
MPNAFFSHQVPGLLIKSKFPRWIDGTAICIAAMVPDLNVFVDLFSSFRFRNLTHSLLGLVIWGFPITIILTLIFANYISSKIAKISEKQGFIFKIMRFLGFDEFKFIKKKKFTLKFILIVFYSSLIGGFTHLVLDLPAHGNIEMFFPLVLQNASFLLTPIAQYNPITLGPLKFGGTLHLYEIVWSIEDTFLLISSIFILRYMKTKHLIVKWNKDSQLS